MNFRTKGVFRRSVPSLLYTLAFGVLSGCTTYPTWLPSLGSSTEQVQQTPDTPSGSGIQIVDVNDAVARKLLDALAAAGGTRQPVNKMTLKVTRGNQVQALPLDTIIRDPRQNIVLLPGDVVTSLFQPLSFTVLGATGKNEELNFEAQGISLAQALARSGGLQDARADAQGVFIFRLESPAALELNGKTVATTPEGKIPVIYRVNLKDPATFFVAQSFPVQNKDVLYVSNAPAAELQKFLNIVVSTIYPIANIVSLTM